MKKFILTLAVLILCFGITSAYAVTEVEPVTLATATPKPFDHTVLKNLTGYEYDKFEKSWSYYGAYSKEYSDAYVVIGLQASGSSNGEIVCELYAWVRDEDNYKPIKNIEGIMILADDTLIDCKVIVGDSSSFCLFTSESEQALDLIGKAKTLTFRLVFDYGNAMTFEPTAAQSKEFQTVAKNIYKHHLVQYLNPEYENLFNTLYPITIE